MEGKRSTSCVANPVWMAKLILLKTTSVDLGDMTIECMTHWTLLRNPKTNHVILLVGMLSQHKE